MTIQCCMCKRVRVGDGWESSHEAHATPSSTYCPVCFDRYSRELAVEREAYRRDRAALAERAAV